MPNKLERFTQSARRVMSLAQEAAMSLGSAEIDTEHLLLALARSECAAAAALSDLGVEGAAIEGLARGMSQTAGESGPQLDLSAQFKRALELAVDEARRLRHHAIGGEHLLLGLLRLPECNACQALRQLDISVEELRQAVIAAIPPGAAPQPRREKPSAPRRPAREFEYFLLRSTSRSSGQISHLPLELSARVKAGLEGALKEMSAAGLLQLEERHLVIGLLGDRAGALSLVLAESGVDRGELIDRLRQTGDD